MPIKNVETFPATVGASVVVALTRKFARSTKKTGKVGAYDADSDGSADAVR